MSDNPETTVRVELRNPDDTVFSRGTYKPEFGIPRFFLFAIDEGRAWTIDETSIAPGQPIIYRLGRVGSFIQDPPEDPDA
jgi:hypothetical protein